MAPRLTTPQLLALDIIPRITAMMSILGSFFIIYEVLKSPKKRGMAYHLQMLALSIVDILFSTTWFVLDWPAAKSGWCTAFGFLGLLTVTPEAMLSAGVCVYYLFFVYFQWSEEKILRYQRVLIMFPIIWGLITAILPLAQGMINPGPRTCWLRPAPLACTGSECTPDEFYYELYQFIFLQIPRWISFGVGVISMCCVYYKVSKDEREHGGQAPAGWLWFVQPEEGQDASRAMRSRRMARQAFWYLLNFFLTYVGSTARTIVLAYDGKPSFGLRCFITIFLPWQGFWNAIIYIRPRYMRNREKNPNMSIWRAIFTEDEYDHRLGARANRSTKHSVSGGIFGSILHKSGQGEGQGEGQGCEGEEGDAEAEAELAQLPEEGNEKA
jgi:hypothetical protein